ncbi:MAG: hypothetical protein C0407_17480 [Desulfobacca sp.]|nr:hypothetical protein [Desulfobacca sp.]
MPRLLGRYACTRQAGAPRYGRLRRPTEESSFRRRNGRAARLCRAFEEAPIREPNSRPKQEASLRKPGMKIELIEE